MKLAKLDCDTLFRTTSQFDRFYDKPVAATFNFKGVRTIKTTAKHIIPDKTRVIFFIVCSFCVLLEFVFE